jgi:hypothetical protein
MTGRATKSDADAIREIVESEKERMLARFRSSRFGERLNRNLAEPSGSPHLPARVRPVLRPVWVALAGLIIMAASAAWFLLPRTRAARGRPVIEALFHGLPGLQAIENPPPPLSPVSLATGSPLEKNIASVLSGPAAMKSPQGPERTGRLSAVETSSEPLGLERVYEILVIDRSVERVLADISPKTKEG